LKQKRGQKRKKAFYGCRITEKEEEEEKWKNERRKENKATYQIEITRVRVANSKLNSSSSDMLRLPR